MRGRCRLVAAPGGHRLRRLCHRARPPIRPCPSDSLRPTHTLCQASRQSPRPSPPPVMPAYAQGEEDGTKQARRLLPYPPARRRWTVSDVALQDLWSHRQQGGLKRARSSSYRQATVHRHAPCKGMGRVRIRNANGLWHASACGSPGHMAPTPPASLHTPRSNGPGTTAVGQRGRPPRSCAGDNGDGPAVRRGRNRSASRTQPRQSHAWDSRVV